MKSTHFNMKALLCLTTILAPVSSVAYAQTGGTQASELALDEIVVTATRREQSLNEVPASIAAFSKVEMDKRGIRDVTDIALLTPGLNFVGESQFTGSNARIAIRGIASNVGAATTGVYINDLPIQSRSVGFATANTYPRIFDLERVEVLRGPQGTLFGAGAEGGVVRFITPKPSLTEKSVYGRAEVSTTKNGAESYEAGLAMGGAVD